MIADVQGNGIRVGHTLALASANRSHASLYTGKVIECGSEPQESYRAGTMREYIVVETETGRKQRLYDYQMHKKAVIIGYTES